MIPIEEEDPDLYEHTGLYECCFFCQAKTSTWHKESNNPVCWKCAQKHDASDLSSSFKGSKQDGGSHE